MLCQCNLASLPRKKVTVQTLG